MVFVVVRLERELEDVGKQRSPAVRTHTHDHTDVRQPQQSGGGHDPLIEQRSPFRAPTARAGKTETRASDRLLLSLPVLYANETQQYLPGWVNGSCAFSNQSAGYRENI